MHTSILGDQHGRGTQEVEHSGFLDPPRDIASLSVLNDVPQSDPNHLQTTQKLVESYIAKYSILVKLGKGVEDGI